MARKGFLMRWDVTTKVHPIPKNPISLVTLGEIEKPKGGFLMGTSPEFEIAIYTVAHLLAGNSDQFK